MGSIAKSRPWQHRYWLITSKNSVPLLPYHILQAGWIAAQMFWAWDGVYTSLLVGCSIPPNIKDTIK